MTEGPLWLWRILEVQTKQLSPLRETHRLQWPFQIEWEGFLHPVKVLMDTERYFYPDCGGIWVKFNCQSSPGLSIGAELA